MSFTAPGGGGAPAGSNTQVQFNNAGAFGGSADLIWSSNILRLGALTGSGSIELLGSVTLQLDGIGVLFSADSGAHVLHLKAASTLTRNRDVTIPDVEGTIVVSTATWPNVNITGDLGVTGDITNDGNIEMAAGDLIAHDNTKGMVLQSPNGHYWRISVSNAGALSTADLGTSFP